MEGLYGYSSTGKLVPKIAARYTSAVRGQFLDGYVSVHRLTPAEASWWDALVLWTSLMMVPSGADPTGWRDAAMSQMSKLVA